MRALSTVLAAWLLAATASASTASIPVEVRAQGAKPMRLVVAQGPAFPCSSPENHRLIEGKIHPGEVVRASTTTECVCVQHTREPFTEIDWAPPFHACRPRICTGFGRYRRCVPAPDPTIRIVVESGSPRQ